MFDFIRTHQRLMQFILLVLVVPSFALIGVSGYSTYVSGDEKLVEVGKSAVTIEDFDRARRNQLDSLQRQLGGAFDPAMLDTPQQREELLESLIERRLILDQAIQNRLSVSDAVLRSTIASIPEFQDNGQFSQERYAAVLAAMGYANRDFEEGQRLEMALQRVVGPVAQTAQVPAPVLEAVAQALTAERTVRSKEFVASDYLDDVVVSDDEVQQWYDNNANRLQVPESVTAHYLVLNEAAAMQSLPKVDDDQLQAYYQQNKSRFVQPGRSLLSHILFEADTDDAAALQKARERAEAVASQVAANPEQFGQLAQEHSDDAGSASEGGKLGWITPGSWPAGLETAAFALNAGEVSGVVEGPEGLHIFMALEVEPEHGETFDQARSKIEAEVARQLGAERYAEMASELTDLVYDNPETLEVAAATLGLELKTAAGIAADQLLPASMVAADAAADSPDASLLSDPRVRRALFSSSALADKHNSGVIELSPDTMIVVRVQSFEPAHTQAFERAAAFIRDNIQHEKAVQAARDAGQAALLALESTPESTDGFAKAQQISRFDSQQLPKLALDEAFKLDAADLPAYKAADTDNGYVILRVEQASDGTTDIATLGNFSQELQQLQAAAEIAAVIASLREQVGVKRLPEGEKLIAEGDAD